MRLRLGGKPRVTVSRQIWDMMAIELDDLFISAARQLVGIRSVDYFRAPDDACHITLKVTTEELGVRYVRLKISEVVAGGGAG